MAFTVRLVNQYLLTDASQRIFPEVVLLEPAVNIGRRKRNIENSLDVQINGASRQGDVLATLLEQLPVQGEHIWSHLLGFGVPLWGRKEQG